MSIIGKNIKKIRILHNLNQKAMGELFQISRGSIGSYEEGRAEPKIETVIRIAHHFNLSIDKILKKELTVNDLSNFAKKISNLIPEVEETPLANTKTNQSKLFLEQRVSILEEKIEKLENLINNI